MLKKTVIILCCCLAAYAAYSSLTNNAHQFTEQQCADCHAVAPDKNDRSTLRLTAPVGMLCKRCHAQGKDDYLSHPVDMKPEHVTLPADLPLSGDGKMTCATCHDIHASAPPNHEGTWYFLRRDLSGRSFCASCHPGGNVTPGQISGHAPGLAAAHMKYTEGDGGLIDNISMTCLSCHDAGMATRSDVKVGSFSHGYDTQSAHPIGVKYRRALRTHGGLRPTGQLNKKIKLIDGMVGCTSCHDPYSTERKMLVLNNDKAQLCMECHDK